MDKSLLLQYWPNNLWSLSLIVVNRVLHGLAIQFPGISNHNETIQGILESQHPIVNVNSINITIDNHEPSLVAKKLGKIHLRSKN